MQDAAATSNGSPNLNMNVNPPEDVQNVTAAAAPEVAGSPITVRADQSQPDLEMNVESPDDVQKVTAAAASEVAGPPIPVSADQSQPDLDMNVAGLYSLYTFLL